MKKSKFNTNHYLPLISTLFIAIIFTFASSAHATLQIRLTQGGQQKTIIDQGALDTDPGTLGSVVWSGHIGVFNVNISTVGKSKPVLGSASDPMMSLYWFETANTQPGTLTVEVTDTDFGPLDPHVLGFTANINGTVIGNSVTFNAYDDVTNAAYGPGVNIASGTWNGSGMMSWGNTYTANVPTSSPFSLTMKADITHTGVGETTQFDAAIESRVSRVVPPVPEPGTILLLGLGLLGLGIIGKKKREKA